MGSSFVFLVAASVLSSSLLLLCCCVQSSSGFRIAFTSCTDTVNANFVNAYKPIADAEPDVFVHLGDLVYSDRSRSPPWRDFIESEPNNFDLDVFPRARTGFLLVDVAEETGPCNETERDQPRLWSYYCIADPDYSNLLTEAYDAMFGVYQENPHWQRIVDTADVYLVVDDHDFGANDWGFDHLAKQFAKDYFLQKAPKKTPYDPAVTEREGMYQTYTYTLENEFLLQIILLDDQWFREYEMGGTYFGDSQWDWIEEQFQVAADFRVICAGSPLFFFVQHDALAGNAPEFKRYVDLLAQYGIDDTNAIHIVGDTHHGYVRVHPADTVIFNGLVTEPGEFHGPVDPLPIGVWEAMSSGLTQALPGFRDGANQTCVDTCRPSAPNKRVDPDCADLWVRCSTEANLARMRRIGMFYQESYGVDWWRQDRYFTMRYNFGVLDIENGAVTLQMYDLLYQGDDAMPNVTETVVRTVVVNENDFRCPGTKIFDSRKEKCVGCKASKGKTFSKESERCVRACPKDKQIVYDADKKRCKCTGENFTYKKKTKSCQCKKGFSESDEGVCV